MAYFPNGSSASILEDQCDRCKLPNDAPCPILLMQLTYNYDQFTNGETNKVADVMNTLAESGMTTTPRPESHWGACDTGRVEAGLNNERRIICEVNKL